MGGCAVDGADRIHSLFGFVLEDALLAVVDPGHTGFADPCPRRNGNQPSVRQGHFGKCVTIIKAHLDGSVPIKRLDPGPIEVPATLPAIDIGHRSLAIDRILTDTLLAGLKTDLDSGLEIEAVAFARCKETVDYDIGMTNFIQNGPRIPAVFMNE